MPITYFATLKDNQLEWLGESPPQLDQLQPLSVSVTIVESILEVNNLERGMKMAAALDKIASRRSLLIHEKADQWEREIREDRPLHGRSL